MKNNIYNPKVTIIITSKNYDKFLKNSVNSAINQSYKNIELYLVDDNSKDTSVKIIKDIKKKNPKINVILNKKSKGLQKISNFVLKKCKGIYFIRLDADDWLHKDSIKKMVNIFKKKKLIGAVYGNYFYTNQSGNKVGYEKNLNIIKKHIAPHGACTMYKVSDLKKVKGYFTDIKAQDGWDAWLKLRNKINYYHLKAPVFYYRQHEMSLTKRKMNILKERGKIFNKAAEIHKNYNQKVVAVIPIKNSFNDLKNVPFKKIGGITLIDKQIKTLKKIKNISDIIFTSSNSKIIKYLKKKENIFKNRKVFVFKRPKIFEKSISSLQEILKYSYLEYKKKGGNCEIFLFLNLHILRNRLDHVDSSINLMKISEFDIIFSVFKEKEPIFKFQRKEFNLLNAGRFNNLDFNSETIYKFNGSVICGKWKILSKGNMFKRKSGFVETHKDEIQNINQLNQFQ